MLEKTKKRLVRKERIRAKISWTASRPRLSVFRSLTHISVQLIDDTVWKTLASASDLKLKKEGTKTEIARKVWEEMAKKLSELKIDNIVFDRNWFAYHWRVKMLADALREWWLKF
jgi:large subunit ribosomal protein L18